jgi:DNA-binding NarL/FixJ family response regulator
VIRVLIVDDHTLVRAGLCRLVDAEADMLVIGQASCGREATRLSELEKPDVVVLDYGLPDFDGLETTRRIVALDKGIRVLILTMYANEEYATRVVRAGASGFIVKAASTDDLLAAIRKVASRGVYISPEILERMVARMGPDHDPAPESELSDREVQVLVQLARGSATREVSTSLGLSMSTVETYRSRILQKLCLRNNSDITRFAIRRGLIEVV